MARLLDSGEFVVEDGGGFVWRSFDHPTDKLIPGMKLGWDAARGINRNLTVWKSPTDPSPGKYSLYLDPRGIPQLILADEESNWVWRGGPWNGVSFSGTPLEANARVTLGLSFKFVWNDDELSYTFHVGNNSVASYLYADSGGFAARYVWIGNKTIFGNNGAGGGGGASNKSLILNRWDVYWQAPQDPCGYVDVCGTNGICNADNIPLCSCMNGFMPADPAGWALSDGSNGCKRMTDLDCDKGTDGFVVLGNAKLPDTAEAVVNMSMGLNECREWCLSNCSCSAYASANVSAGGSSGCVTWTGELKDTRVYVNAGQDLYIRLAAADIVKTKETSPVTTLRIFEITICFLSVVVLSFPAVLCVWKETNKRRKHRGFSATMKGNNGEKEISELPMFDMYTIKIATNYFSIKNKLGEGGFGIVYKGKLGEGQEIAVKRLAKTSTQGIYEFKNEVTLIAKLQHRNLVRLLGCCIEGDERLIVYEYMQNKSLDAFLFDEYRRVLLDWPARYRIILGIARGLLYLHEDSRLTIIHRDLKASNILLDNEMSPKISDFGMARIFGGDETVVNTTKVVGTYGYMSPEYAMDGIFSAKTDVFSFGVLVLEIISGRRNRGIYTIEHRFNLVGEAWSLWNEEKEMELLDDCIRNSISMTEVFKCIKLALLCVQEQAEDRPSMSSVVLQLCSDIDLLPNPIQPCFITPRHSMIDLELQMLRKDSMASGDLTITMEGR